MSTDLLQRAEALLGARRPADAIALIRGAAERDDPDALMRMATWHLIGVPLPRDLAIARQWLRRAVLAGHVDAALMEVALAANGSGGRPDWAGALRLLEQAAKKDFVAEAHLRLVRSMALGADGMPLVLPDRIRLRGEVEAYHLPAFLTRDECAHVAATGGEVLERAVIADPRTGQLVPHPIRTSDAGTIGPTREDLVVRALNLRIAAISGTDVAAGEPLVVLRYAPGQQYRAHLDTLPGTPNQRAWTVIIYLNEGYGGGETRFPDTGLSVKGQAGDALLFRNIDNAGRPLSLSRHAGMPVTTGQKWVCTRWIRQAPLDLWAAR